MKKVIVFDIISLLTSITLYVASMVINVSAFIYDFTSRNHLNVILILRCISIILLVVFVILSAVLIIWKTQKQLLTVKAEKTIRNFVLVGVVLASVISVLIVQFNYQDYGEALFEPMQANNAISYVNESSEIDTTGSSLFSTKTISAKIQNVDGANFIVDGVSSKYTTILKQYRMQFDSTIYGDPEKITYRDLTVLKWHSVTSLADYADVLGNAIDSTNETNIYLIEDDNNIYYFESFAVVNDKNYIDSEQEIENVYLIYNELNNSF